MVQGRMEWERTGTASWKIISELKRALEISGGRAGPVRVYSSNYKVARTISRRDIEQYVAGFWDKEEYQKVYIAKVPDLRDPGGKWLYTRDWLVGTIAATDLEIGEVVEAGWSTVENRILIGHRLYYVVLEDSQGGHVFVRFGRRQIRHPK
jgi:hypothetical protein